MKAWIVHREETDVIEWDEMESCVVVAADEGQARQLAADNARIEGREVWLLHSVVECIDTEQPGFCHGNTNWG